MRAESVNKIIETSNRLFAEKGCVIGSSDKRVKDSLRVIGLNGDPNRNVSTVKLIKWVLDVCVEAGTKLRQKLRFNEYIKERKSRSG